MDGSGFDRFARSLVIRPDRRRVLRGLSGAVAALLGASQGRQVAEARRTGGGKPTGRCGEGQTNCRGSCVDLTDNPNHCGACFTVCSPGKNCCGGSCTNLQNDDANCGTCGHECLTRDEDTPLINGAEICVNGTCEECSFGRLGEGRPTRCCRGFTACGSEVTGFSCVPGDSCPA